MSDIETRVGPLIITWSRPSIMRVLYFAIPALVLFWILYLYGGVSFTWSMLAAAVFTVMQRIFTP